MREYEKNGKSDNFLSLQKKFKLLQKREIEKFRIRLMDKVAGGNPGSIYKHLRRFGDKKGRQVDNKLTIQSHVSEHLLPAQLADCISSFFAEISQQYAPISLDNLSPRVRHHLTHSLTDNIPILEEF